MGRTFTLEIKQGGEWQRVTSVFPFISGELLDERLDEGSITFFDRTKAHKPLTEFRIAFYKGAVGEEPDNDIYGKNTEYFILANDNSAEYPVGSGVYKHEAYIIERTKLLEGVLCPSITFTNHKYYINDNSVEFTYASPTLGQNDMSNAFIPNNAELSLLQTITTPKVDYGSGIYLPSVYDLTKKFFDFVEPQYGYSLEPYYDSANLARIFTKVVCADINGNILSQTDMTSTELLQNQIICRKTSNPLIVTYFICIDNATGNDRTMAIEYELAILDTSARQLKPYRTSYNCRESSL